MSLLSELWNFLDAEKAGIASKVLASASYDFLKKRLNFSSLKEKIGAFFRKPAEAEKFLEQVCTRQVTNDVTSDVSKLYKEITGNAIPENLMPFLKEWLSENAVEIQNINTVTISQSSGINIGVQSAARDIINVQGDYNVNPKVNED